MKAIKNIRITRIMAFVLCLVLIAGCLSGCKKESKEEDNTLGNTSGIADTEADYPDASTPSASTETVGNNGEAAENKEMSYIDQKAEGNGQPVPGQATDTAEEQGYDPIFITNAADIPEGTYCIEHKNDDGTSIYYPLYPANGSYYVVPQLDGAASVQPERFMWTKIGYDDTAIPTMHEGDTLVYKSADAIPEAFTFERFSDEGYTIGVAGLVQAPSGNYLYDLEKSYLNETADTVGLKLLGAAQVYIVSAGNVRVSPSTVTATGTIKNLRRNENYLCDVRTGTESISAAFRANNHLFVSLEQYKLATFYFSAKHTIEIGIEATTPTGYYSVNNCGLFRYVAKKDEGKELKAADYNIPFITINTNGDLVSTQDGYAIDENGFIVKER